MINKKWLYDLGAQNDVIWVIQSIFSTDIFHLFLCSLIYCVGIVLPISVWNEDIKYNVKYCE